MLCWLQRLKPHYTCLKTMSPKGPQCCVVCKDGRYIKKEIELCRLKCLIVVLSGKIDDTVKKI